MIVPSWVRRRFSFMERARLGIGKRRMLRQVASAGARRLHTDSSTSLHSLTARRMDGTQLVLKTLAGRPALMLNVASE